MSSTSSTSASSTTSSTAPSNTTSSSSSSSSGGSGISSSLYLFTFLVTIVILGLISSGLLLRAYYVRRSFQRRVEDAIRAGQPLPHDAATALGLNRRLKKEKKHGPMPSIWEAQMDRDGEKWESLQEKREWEDVTPLCVTRPAPPPLPSPDQDIDALFPRRRGPRFLQPFLTPRLPDLSRYMASHPDPTRPDLHRVLTTQTLPPVRPVWTIPDQDEEITVGVLIALPVEGRADERWHVEDMEDAEIPEVCLGVMECTVRGTQH